MPILTTEPISDRPLDQAWFWTKEWQEREREADEDIAKGKLSGPFETAADLIRYLRGLPSEQQSPV